jgi:hypothetical protein
MIMLTQSFQRPDLNICRCAASWPRKAIWVMATPNDGGAGQLPPRVANPYEGRHPNGQERDSANQLGPSSSRSGGASTPSHAQCESGP